MRRPLIFLDVDGPLITFAPRPGNSGPERPDEGGNPLLDRLDPDDGRALRALPGDLVWATTWMAEANEIIAPRLGLPDLPVVDWPDEEVEPPRGVHWKTSPLVRWAAGRPFVWLDDEIGHADRRWVAAHHPGPALPHRIDPSTGFTPDDFAVIRRWLRDIGPSAG